MAREFEVVADNVTTVAAVVTLVFINPAAAPNFNLEYRRHWVGFSGSNTSGQQRVQLVTQVTAFPTLTGATPVKLKPADPNVSIIVSGTAGAAGTCGVNASAEGAGGKTVVHPDIFNVLNGWLYVPGPDEQRVMPAGSASGLGLYLPTAPVT